MPIPPYLQLLYPWTSFEGTAETKNLAEVFTARLESDLPPKHVLQGLKFRAVASRGDRDDVLYEVEGGPAPLAVVHLTWRKETLPAFPRTKFFESWEQWVREEMIPASADFEP